MQVLSSPQPPRQFDLSALTVLLQPSSSQSSYNTETADIIRNYVQAVLNGGKFSMSLSKINRLAKELLVPPIKDLSANLHSGDKLLHWVTIQAIDTFCIDKLTGIERRYQQEGINSRGLLEAYFQLLVQIDRAVGELSLILPIGCSPSLEKRVSSLLSKNINSRPDCLQNIMSALARETDADPLGSNSHDRTQVSEVLLKVIKSLCHCGVESLLVQQHLAGLENKLKQWVNSKIPTMNLPVYLKELELVLNSEKNKAEGLFDEHCGESVWLMIRRICVEDIIGEILNSQLERLLLDYKKVELTFLWSLLKGGSGGDQFISFLESFIVNRGENLTSEGGLTALLNFYNQLTQLVGTVFVDEPRVRSSLDRALSVLMDKRAIHSARMLAHHMGSLLERGKLIKADAEQALNDSLKLLQFIQHKKVFQQTYNQL